MADRGAGTTPNDGPLEPQNAGGIDQQRPESRPAKHAGLAPASPSGGPLGSLIQFAYRGSRD